MQLPRDGNAYIRRLYFNTNDNVNIYTTASIPLVAPSAPLQYLQLARLNSTFGVIVYRNPNDNWKVWTSVIDTSGSQLVVWPATMVNPGTGKGFGFGVSVAAVAPDRLVFSYNDANSQAFVQDASVCGTSVVLGR